MTLRVRLLILAEGRGSAACSRWGAKRPRNQTSQVRQTNRVETIKPRKLFLMHRRLHPRRAQR